MGLLTDQDIVISGAYPVDTLSSLYLYGRVNQHGYLTYNGILYSEAVEKIIDQKSENAHVILSLSGTIVFNGQPIDIEVVEEKKMYLE